MLKKVGITYYVNLASPFVYDNQKVKYIDYDLDLKLYPNKDIRLIDVKEYGYHRKKYNYGDDIDKILRFNITNIKECMGKNEFPFCDDLIRKYYHDFIELTIPPNKSGYNENKDWIMSFYHLIFKRIVVNFIV